MTFRHRTEKGQHFLQDKAIVKKLVAEAQLSQKDTVLEIGAGAGSITSELAKVAGKVIAVENDVRLKEDLSALPSKVEVIFTDALQVLEQRKDFQKIVGNIPFQLAEPLLHYLCTARHVLRSVLIVPKTFGIKTQEHPIFSAFLNIISIQDVPKTAFHPSPRTDSAIITITARKNIDNDSFLRQQLYLQKDKRLKNGLREALIELFRRKEIILTKKQALEIIDSLKVMENLLETLIARLPPKIYASLAEQVSASEHALSVSVRQTSGWARKKRT